MECLNFEFEEKVIWRPEESVDISIWLKELGGFLLWYRDLSPHTVTKTRELGIFDEFRDEYIHIMATNEGEGLQSRQ